MTYVIDGHNLIPKIHGMSLRQMDDEMMLISLLQEFCRVKQKSVDVFFDDAPAGMAKTRRFGRVTAHFTPIQSSADDAIQRFLMRMGRNARNVILVSSDHMVQAEGKRSGAQVVTSEQFAAQMAEARMMDSSVGGQEKALDEAEVEEWLRLFKEGKKDKK